MLRIYSEIRISHKTEEEKKQFKEKSNKQASKLGLNLSEYIRLIIELDTATNIIARLKGRG